jgi:hypothetical protein
VRKPAAPFHWATLPVGERLQRFTTWRVGGVTPDSTEVHQQETTAYTQLFDRRRAGFRLAAVKNGTLKSGAGDAG